MKRIILPGESDEKPEAKAISSGRKRRLRNRRSQFRKQQERKARSLEGARIRLDRTLRRYAHSQAQWWRFTNAEHIADDAVSRLKTSWLSLGSFDDYALELQAKQFGIKAMLWKSVRHAILREAKRQGKYHELFRPFTEAHLKGAGCE